MKTKQLQLTAREIKALRVLISQLPDNQITITLEQLDTKLYFALINAIGKIQYKNN
tara:strand:- start:3269 stop:3436 length:168 start_codon:yes stop_codon:yes gene_type:complete